MLKKSSEAFFLITFAIQTFTMVEKKKDKFKSWLTRPYQLVIYRDGNFEVLKKIRMNKISFMLVIFAMFVIFFAVISLLVVYTPAKYLVPGYPDRKTLELIYDNAYRVDSLAVELDAREEYLKMIRDVIFEEVPVDGDFAIPVANLTDEQIQDFNDPTKPRMRIDDSDNVNVVGKDDIMPNFFVPMVGKIVSEYDKRHGHYGVDIASSGDMSVFSVLSGIVIASSFSVENGYSITIQHKKGIVSVYKHCESPLVKEGQKVRQGDQIALCEKSTDNNVAHMHFELWCNGESMNPTEYIEF